MLETEQLPHGIVRLTIGNDGAANALTDQLLDQLRATLQDLDSDLSVRCAVLRGAGGRVFSSGYHTTQLAPARFRGLPDPIGPTCEAMQRGRVPVVGCVNGHVFGGAVEIAAACDLRVGQCGASVGIPAGRFGICYAPGGIGRLVAVMGRPLALELLLTGEPVSAERAATAGFFCQVVDTAEVDAAAVAVATSIATAAPLAIESMRRIVIDATAPGPRIAPAESEEARELFKACLASEDLEEGLRALAERRDPHFQRR